MSSFSTSFIPPSCSLNLLSGNIFVRILAHFVFTMLRAFPMAASSLARDLFPLNSSAAPTGSCSHSAKLLFLCLFSSLNPS